MDNILNPATTEAKIVNIQDHFDVWGNAQDGWEVNNSRWINGVSIVAEPDAALIESLKVAGLLAQSANVDNISIVDYGTFTEVNDSTLDDYPLFTIYFD